MRDRAAEFRARAIDHKQRRTVHVGEHLTLQFEDELTVRYQIQEMLRIERIFEEEGIRGELDATQPAGSATAATWKATMLLEYPDADERRAQRWPSSKGIDAGVWVQARRLRTRVHAIADEDLERENDEKDLGGAFPAIRAAAAT